MMSAFLNKAHLEVHHGPVLSVSYGMLECSHCACSNFTLVKMEFRYKQCVLPILVGCYHIPEIPQRGEGCAECRRPY